MCSNERCPGKEAAEFGCGDRVLRRPCGQIADDDVVTDTAHDHKYVPHAVEVTHSCVVHQKDDVSLEGTTAIKTGRSPFPGLQMDVSVPTTAEHTAGKREARPLMRRSLQTEANLFHSA